MDSIEFLNFSKRLLTANSLLEIDYRQAVGRSYYCAYHQVREKSMELGIPVDAYRGGTHASLVKTLVDFRPANKTLKAIGFRLNNFHSLRVTADYKLDQNVDEKLANQSITECEKIIFLLKQV